MIVVLFPCSVVNCGRFNMARGMHYLKTNSRLTLFSDTSDLQLSHRVVLLNPLLSTITNRPRLMTSSVCVLHYPHFIGIYQMPIE